MRVIAGTARHLNLKTVPGSDTRPTTDRIKETLFNILQTRVPGSRFLDLYAGSGAIGIEALSRGAASAVFVERDGKACQCILENLKFTRLFEQGTLLKTDVRNAIRNLDGEKPFDIIFMDPPYDLGMEEEVFADLSESTLVDSDTLIIVEAALERDFGGVRELGFEITRSKNYKTNKHVFFRKIESE